MLVNLASEAYFKSLQPKKFGVPVLPPAFEDWSGGKFRVINFYARRARGLMARYAIVNRLTDAAGLQDCAIDGYTYADQGHSLSSGGSCRWSSAIRRAQNPRLTTRAIHRCRQCPQAG
ncbi:MAG: peroxide stress protein YaaA [Candidatus Accumulibacter necessarius]|uniref:peroxide stress protein YaaA n=1 Tax=Candidatus Accumulibacter necessarius TaxID=2954386 RepID=UPI002FC30397